MALKSDLWSQPTHVYKAADINGELLYVGITCDLKQRMSQHKRESAWWSKHAIITHETFPSRSEALTVESFLIETCDPPYNIAGTDRFGQTMKDSHLRRCRKRLEPPEPTFIASQKTIELWLNDDEIDTIEEVIRLLRFIQTMKRPNSGLSICHRIAFDCYSRALDNCSLAITALGYEVPWDIR
jgi:hypothetical protein